MSKPDEGTARLSAAIQRKAPAPAGRRLERAAIPGGMFSKIEPLRLDESMTRSDLAWCLERLRFGHAGDRHLLTIDRGVRDYLVWAIKHG